MPNYLDNADAADGQGDGGNAAQEALLHLVLLLALLLPGIGGGDIAHIRAQQAVQVALEQGDGLGGRGGVLGLCHKTSNFGFAADDAVHGIGNYILKTRLYAKRLLMQRLKIKKLWTKYSLFSRFQQNIKWRKNAEKSIFINCKTL